MAVVKVSSKLHNHPKLVRLKDEFGPDAALSLFRLWLWCADRGSNVVNEAEVRKSGYEEVVTNRPVHQDVRVEGGIGKNFFSYISLLIEMDAIKLLGQKDGETLYEVRNPFTPVSVATEEKVADSNDVLKVLKAYRLKFPSYPRQGVETDANKRLISERMEAGWKVDDLIGAIEGMSQTQWYQENTDLGLKYAISSCDKVAEHLVKRNKKPVATREVGHHSGSGSFGNGRSSSF